MVSKLVKEHERRSKLCDFLYDVSKLLISGVGVGGVTPFLMGQVLTVRHYISVVLGLLAAILFAYLANRLMTYNDIK